MFEAGTQTTPTPQNGIATSDTLAQMKRDFDRDGYAIARGLFSPEEVAHIKAEFMALNAQGPVDGVSDDVWKSLPPSDPLAFYPRLMHPHRHPELSAGRLSHDVMLDARLHSPLAAFMDDEPAAVQSMFYFKPAGARGQDLHQDNYYLRVKPGTCCAMWLAVDDADPENGGMVVVPGSSKLEVACPGQADSATSFTSDHVDVPDGLEAVALNLKAGDVLFFNGSVIHGSSPNTSADRFRRAFICHYVPATSSEVSHWYTNPLRFDLTPVAIPHATGGGPCGTGHAAARGPH